MDGLKGDYVRAYYSSSKVDSSAFKTRLFDLYLNVLCTSIKYMIIPILPEFHNVPTVVSRPRLVKRTK